MFHVLENFIELRIVYRDEMYKSSEQVDKKDVDASKEVFDTLEAVKSLRDMTTAKKKKKQRHKATAAKLDKLYELAITSDTKSDDALVLAVAFFHMSLLYTECDRDMDVKRMAIGEGYLIKCLKLLEERYCERKAISTVMKALAELKLIQSQLHEPEMCYDLLMTSMEVYLEYTQDTNDYPHAIDMSFVLGMDDECDVFSALEILYLQTLECLVDLYQTGPQNMHKLVEYTHKVLNEETEGVISALPLRFETAVQNTERYNDWILTLVDLCRYFIYHKRFVEARDHLMVAQAVLDCFDRNELPHAEKLPAPSREWINIMCEFMTAHVSTSRGYYATEILHSAKENIMKATAYGTREDRKADDSRTLLLFSGLTQLLEDPEYTYNYQQEFLTDYNEIKKALSESVMCYTIARNFFTMERSLAIHSQLMIDISKAYRYAVATGKFNKSNEQYELLDEGFAVMSPVSAVLFAKSDPTLLIQQKAMLHEQLMLRCSFLDALTEDLTCYFNPKRLKHLNEIVEFDVNLFGCYKESMNLI